VSALRLHSSPISSRTENKSAEEDTVKASNFEPHVHFGLQSPTIKMRRTEKGNK
jgi:hypothetical protein